MSLSSSHSVCIDRYWDGDAFEEVMCLDRHHGEVWSIAISSLGDFIVSGSHDRSLRMWERTADQVFLQEEQEKKLEQQFEKELEHGSGFADNSQSESASASRRSKESTIAGERLIESLELAGEERQKQIVYAEESVAAQKSLPEKQRKDRLKKIKAGQVVPPLLNPPPRNLLMLGLTPSKYILRALRGIKRNELEEALLVLPFHIVEQLFEYLSEFISNGDDVDLAARCAFFMLKVYQTQLVSNQMIVDTLNSLKVQLRKQLQLQKDTVGFNLAGMRFVKRSLENEKMTKIPFDASKQAKKARRDD